MPTVAFKHFFYLAFSLFSISNLFGQDVPLFSQKLTNSFMYNPAIAGNSYGSITLSHRTNYSGVQGGPVNNYFSIQTPLSNYRMGIGINYYQENINIFANSYFSTAIAYSFHFDRFKTLSMGISGEFNSIKLNNSSESTLSDDVTIQQYAYGKNATDFSFGMVYQTKFIKVGAAANRLGTTWLANEKLLSTYYSGNIHGLIPIRNNRDLFEPYITYRKTASSSDMIDVGMYYTYNSKIIVGMATRNGNIFSSTFAIRLDKHTVTGFSHEIVLGTVAGFAGSSNEVTIRFDFKDKAHQEQLREDYKTSIAYRRKALYATTKKSPKKFKSPKGLHRAQQKISAYSPNKRYQSIIKSNSIKIKTKKGKPRKAY
jgi:type IX secretion system PorP/SprF family membrane protein